MSFIKNFSELSKEDVQIAGGKGASLSEMSNAGFSVPKGFVILTTAFEKFLEEGKKEIPENIKKEILEEFKKIGSKHVAVRSSATSEDGFQSSWAGQLETYLNTNEEHLFNNIKKCWASLFSPRAMAYKVEKGLEEKNISVAVVVQEMVESEVSGVSFSVHPVTQDKNQLVIEACYGLGEAVVSGKITPDNYIIEKEGLRTVEKTINKQRKSFGLGSKGNEWKNIDGSKQKLSNDQILELAKTIIELERFYGFPIDVEWASKEGKFFITQSRPITTLTNLKYKTANINLFDIKWKHYLSRPFNIFGASLWHLWYDSEQAEEIIGFRMKDVLFVEENPKVARQYRKEEDLKIFSSKIKEISNDEDRFKEIVKAAKDFNDRSRELLKGKSISLENAIDFLTRTAIYATVLPYLIPKYGSSDAKILKDCEKLRVSSVYPELVNKVVYPLAKKRANTDKVSVLTVNEVLKSDNSKVDERLKSLKENKRYVYSIIGGDEKVGFVEDVKKIISEIEQISFDSDTIKGQVAFPGKIMGNACLALTHNIDDIKFNDGDVLVAINSNPVLMPLLKKCSAIVTDEGGITCHAAVISRELQKPCIIGTKIATSVIKNGDKVEVNAKSGIVKILKN